MIVVGRFMALCGGSADATLAADIIHIAALTGSIILALAFRDIYQCHL